MMDDDAAASRRCEGLIADWRALTPTERSVIFQILHECGESGRPEVRKAWIVVITLLGELRRDPGPFDRPIPDP
jgi:hypothetical protein